jgi:hypothetical protein
MVTTHTEPPVEDDSARVVADARWVFLGYRLPREPSAPRLALWRALQRLGALQISDGFVALPRSARNVEHFGWLAATIEDQHGSASVWLAEPLSARTHAEHASSQRSTVDAEYRTVLAEAQQALESATQREAEVTVERRRTVRRLRGRLRRIGSRDYFAAPTGDAARAAVDRLARAAEVVPA